MKWASLVILRCLAGIAIFATLDTFAASPAATNQSGPNAIPQQVFDGMRENFQPAKAQGVHVRYQFILSGPHGGDWWIEVNDGKFKMGKGRIANAHVTFLTSDRDWVALSNGTLSGAWATLTGRLKVNGSHALARKLDEMCP